MNDLLIREGSIDDAEIVARYVTQLGYPTTAAEMEERLSIMLARGDYVLLLAETSGRVVGMVGAYLTLGLELSGFCGRLTGMFVDEAWRGRGIGRSLMKAVEVWLESRGASLLLITSGSHRHQAHAFYRHLGYQETGLRFAKQLGKPGHD
jgi:GNAT superfamily N-acetyltransferase